MRFLYSGQARDSMGLVMGSAAIGVYLAGTSTLATIYSTATGVASANPFLSDANGFFTFYFDDKDYYYVQQFDILIQKCGAAPIQLYKVWPNTPALVTNIVNSALVFNYITDIPPGVIYQKSGIGTMVFNSYFNPGLYQVFSGFSPGDITGLKKARPEWWGAVDDGTDASTPFGCAAASLTLGAGELIVSPPRTYWAANFGIALDGVKVKGEGNTPEIRGVAATPVITAYGTSGSHLNNIEIENLSIRNGTAADPVTSGKEGIVAQYVDKLTLKDLYLNEIEGNYGIALAGVNKFTLRDVTVYRYGGLGVSLLSETQYGLLDNVTVDTPISTAFADVYNFHGGSGGLYDIPGGTFKQFNITYLNCIARNNPIWAAFNCHEGRDMFYINCKSYACLKPFDIAGVDNLKIINPTAYGIDPWPGTGGAAGASALQAYAFGVSNSKDVLIQSGYAHETFLGAYISRCRNWKVDNVNFSNTIRYGVAVTAGSRNGKIINNTFEDVKSYDAVGNCIIRIVSGTGVWDTWIDGNIGVRKNHQLTVQGYTDYTNLNGIGMADDNSYTRIGRNSLQAYTAKYLSSVNDPVLQALIPTQGANEVWAKTGDTVTGANDTPKWVCTNSVPDELWFDSSIATGITVTGTAGDYHVHLATGDGDFIPDGCALVIPGAGSPNLTTAVVYVDRTNGILYLKDALVGSVTGATPTFRSATWAAY